MTKYNELSKEEMYKASEEGIFEHMNYWLRSLNTSKKPIVAVVRGGCVGIAFTSLSLCDFVYCGPDAYFEVPFMRTF